MAQDKEIIDVKNIRRINGAFSWIDRRIITDGFLDALAATGILLYLFLIAVSDRNGLSYYHDDRICRILKIDLFGLGEARTDLTQRGLIAYKYPIYQVLKLPDKPVMPPTPAELAERKRKKDLSYIQKIKQVIGNY